MGHAACCGWLAGLFPPLDPFIQRTRTQTPPTNPPNRYDLKNATSLGMHEDAIQSLRYDPPDVVLVKRVEPERAKNAKKERRRLQRLRARRAAKEAREAREAAAASVASEGDFGEGLEEDFLAFQQELEEDAELRELLAQHAAEGAARAAAGELGEGDDVLGVGGEEDEEGGDEAGGAGSG